MRKTNKAKKLASLIVTFSLVLSLFTFAPASVVSAADNAYCQISAGGLHTVALKTDGTLWAWGHNEFGQLGDGTTTDKHEPTKVKGIADVAQVSAGANHTVALKNDGTLWAWGSNEYGQLGDGTTNNRNEPTQVKEIADVVQLSAGGYHTVALTNDGILWAWGYNALGQLGDGTTTDKHEPTQVKEIADVVQLSAGNHHTVALTNDGILWAWGYNGFGQLGDGTTTDKNKPTQIKEIAAIAQVSAGGYHTVALTNDGSLWAWGYNALGQLGDGTTTDKNKPTQVDIAAVAQVSAGGLHTVALKKDDTLWAWGSNYYGQLGDGTTTSSLIPVKVMEQAARPTINQVERSDGVRRITMRTTTPGATIYYTIDGSKPTTSSESSKKYDDAFHLTVVSDTTIKAIAVRTGMVESEVAILEISVAAVATPKIEQKETSDGKNITITTETAGATIYYTTDDSPPTAAGGKEYTDAFTAKPGTTIKAMATYPGMANSEIAIFDVSVAADKPKIEQKEEGGKWSITITSETAGATIYYTTDGSEPAKSSETYTKAFTVEPGTTVKAMATKSGMANSEIAIFDVSVDTVAKPKIEQKKDGGKWSITITTETAGATIYYTIDKSEPAKSSEKSKPYDKAFTVEPGTTVKAIATKSAMDDSEIATLEVSEENAVAKPEIKQTDIAGGKSITITTETAGATIYYTTDGTDPKDKINEYKDPIKLDSEKTVQAIAAKTGMADSEVATLKVSVDAAGKPKIEQNETADGKWSITITTETKDAKIYYTTDGTNPTDKSEEYKNPFAAESGKTVKAMAAKSGMANSETAILAVGAATYTVKVSSAGTGAKGGGDYAQGAKVSIEAGTAPKDKKFKDWTTTSAGVTFADAKSEKTTFTMPKNDVTVTANFADTDDDDDDDDDDKPWKNPFTDVHESDWFYDDVKFSCLSGLIDGKTDTTFAPEDSLTYAEAIKLAACMHQLYTEGKVTLVIGEPDWYQSYVDYAKKNGIIDKDDNRDWDAKATRAGYMEIFASALPEEAFEAINPVADGAIPDVSAAHPQAAAIYKLYRAGILQGVDTKTHECNPSSNIKRSEVAAILTRMMNPSARLKFSMSNTVKVSSAGEGAKGSGAYAKGAKVSIEAGTAPKGKKFKDWTTTSAGVKFADAKSEKTTFEMPDSDVTVTANFEDDDEDDDDDDDDDDDIIQVAAPKADPPAGEIQSGAQITLKTDTAGATICYTTDGSAPTEKSAKYTLPIKITDATTIKAIAIKQGMKDSPVASFKYTIAVSDVVSDFYIMGRDNYSFKNTSTSFGYGNDYRIPYERFSDLFSKADADLYHGKYSKWGGSCFGFSSTNLVFYNSLLDLKKFSPSAANIHDFKAPGTPNSDLTKLLETYQISQFIPEVSAAEFKNINKIDELVRAVREFQKTGKGGIVLSVGSYLEYSAHAIVPYKVEEKGNGDVVISVYDNNFPDQERFFYANTSTGVWSYELSVIRELVFGTEHDADDYFAFVPMQTIHDLVQSPQKKGGEGMRIFADSANYGVSNKNGVPVEQIDNAYRIIPIGMTENSKGYKGALYQAPDDSYVIKAGSGDSEELHASLSNGDIYCGITTDDISATIRAGFADGDVIQIDSQKSNTFTVSYTKDSGGVDIEGSSNGEFTITQDHGDLILSGEAIITIITHEGSSTGSLNLAAGNIRLDSDFNITTTVT
ncbi:MAG: chitobiase/beta-hexosaminidase C-terminal domain-containing protein [Oscillospiraceae bacterium]|nr:chitobiase/beta-hexosaminidase C-terminal domain-containing protein [Oscillospiraceae bacterium]